MSCAPKTRCGRHPATPSRTGVRLRLGLSWPLQSALCLQGSTLCNLGGRRGGPFWGPGQEGAPAPLSLPQSPRCAGREGPHWHPGPWGCSGFTPGSGIRDNSWPGSRLGGARGRIRVDRMQGKCTSCSALTGPQTPRLLSTGLARRLSCPYGVCAVPLIYTYPQGQRGLEWVSDLRPPESGPAPLTGRDGGPHLACPPRGSGPCGRELALSLADLGFLAWIVGQSLILASDRSPLTLPQRETRPRIAARNWGDLWPEFPQ